MRISRMFTCVIAALALMYGAGCSKQNDGGPYQIVPGYGYIPAGAVVDPNTGFVTYPQTYAPGATVYDPGVVYAGAAPVYAGTTPVYAPAPVYTTTYVKAGKARPRRKARYNRRNARFATVNAPYAAPGYAVTYVNPGYGTATLLSDPNVVPSVTTAPVYAGPAYTDPAFVAPIAAPVVEPIAAAPAVPVTAYAAIPGAEQVAQVAGTNCVTTYRRGRRVKSAKTPRPAGYVPYTVVAQTPAPVVTYSGVYGPYEPVVTSPVYVDPLPLATYTPEPLPVVEAAPAPVADVPAATLIETPVATTDGMDIDRLAEIVAEKLSDKLAAAAEKLAGAARPATEPIVIQPIIQPIVQSPAQYAETAGIQAAAPVLPPLPEQALPAAPFMPLPQGPVVSEPLSAMVMVPGAVSGFEPGVLGAYCPPEICPVPSPVVCGPGQNLSECFTMNEFQLQNTPLQVLRPEMNAPLSFPPAGATIVSQPVTATQPQQQAEADKYRALTPQNDTLAAGPALSVRPNIARPEVSLPAPIGGETMPPVPATAEIESALDAMLSRDARTPALK